MRDRSTITTLDRRYFFRQSDGAVVRIPHEAASESPLGLNEDAIEKVADSIEQLVSLADLE